MRRTWGVLGLGLALLLGAAACGQPGAAGPGAAGGDGLRLDSEPVGAALVTPRFGWVLTQTQLLLTDDGGAGFHAAAVAVPEGSARAAYFSDAQHGWVAAAAGRTIVVAATTDGGLSWSTGTLTGVDEVGSLALGFAGDRTGALLAGRRTSGNFSMGTLWASTDGGTTWSASPAPVNGTVSVDRAGTIWVAGGVFGNQLFGSTDAGRHWTAEHLAVTTGTVRSVAAPVDGVASATVVDGAAARVALLRAGPADRWVESTSLPVRTDPGLAPPLARPAGAVLLADPNGQRLFRAATANGALAPVNAGGLPAGARQVSFVDANLGWALSGSGSCAAAKTDCGYTTELSATGDGGRTWRAVAVFRQ